MSQESNALPSKFNILSISQHGFVYCKHVSSNLSEGSYDHTLMPYEKF